MNTVFFNELSLLPLCKNRTDALRRLLCYSDILLKLKSEISNVEVRYQCSLFGFDILEGMSIGKLCLMFVKEARKSKNNSDLNRLRYLLQSQHDPYIKDEELSEDIMSSYIISNVYFKGSENVIADGFKAAYFMHSICIGFLSDSIWEKHIHTLLVTDANATKEVQVVCISDDNHLKSKEFISWRDAYSTVELLETFKAPYEKLGRYHNVIGRHHGKEKLYAHALKLIQSPYVEEILCSVDYGSASDKDYIAGYEKNNGVIRIMLVWESPKYAMLIKTTGRNMRETKEIAKILKEQFAK